MRDDVIDTSVRKSVTSVGGLCLGWVWTRTVLSTSIGKCPILVYKNACIQQMMSYVELPTLLLE